MIYYSAALMTFTSFKFVGLLLFRAHICQYFGFTGMCAEVHLSSLPFSVLAGFMSLSLSSKHLGVEYSGRGVFEGIIYK